MAVLQPRSGEVVRRGDRLILWGDDYGGAGSWYARQWQISLTNSFPAVAPNVVFDSLLRVADTRTQGATWCEVYLALLNLAAGTTYYVTYRDRNTVGTVSAFATAVSFVTDDVATVPAKWRASQ